MNLEATKVTENILWILAERGLRLGIAFVVGLWVARAIGPEMYGILSYVQATIATVAFLSLASIESIVTRSLVDEPGAEQEIVGSAIILRATGGAMTLLVVVVMSLTLSPAESLVAVVTPIIAAAAIFQSTDIIDCWFRLKLLSRVSAVTRTAALLFGAAMRIAAIQMPSPLVALAFAILLESVASAATMVLSARATGLNLHRLQASWVRAIGILRESVPLVISAVAVGIYVRFGFVLLGNISGTRQVGFFGSATLIVEALHSIAVAVASTLGPVILKQRKDSMERFECRITSLNRRLVIAGVAISAGVCVASAPLVEVIFGKAFGEAAEILSILVWSIVFVYMSVVAEIWFIGHGLQRFFIPKTICGAVVSLTATILLVPRWGAMGLAFATVLCYATSAFLSNVLFRETRPMFTRQLYAFIPWPARRGAG